MRTRALGWGFGLLALVATAGRADEPKPKEAVAWPVVSRDLLRADAPVAIHVHVSVDARVSVRSTVPGPELVWKEHGTVDWAGATEAERDGAVLTTLRTLRTLVKPDPAGVVPHDAEGWARAVLLADLEPDAPWHLAQRLLGLARAAGVRVRHVVLRSEARTANVDMAETERSRPEVPEEGENAPVEPPAPLPAGPPVTVKLFRNNLDKHTSEQYTKVRVGETFTRALPKGAVPRDPEARAARLAQEDAIFEELRAAIEQAKARFGARSFVRAEVNAPFPKGLAVPSREALRMLEAVSSMGFAAVVPEWISRPSEPKAELPAVSPIAWSDADARVAKGDAPLYLQVHIAADGRVTIRSTRGGSKPVWSVGAEAGTLSLEDPKASREAIRALLGEFQKTLSTPSVTPSLWSEDGHSKAITLIDAQPQAPWCLAQWVLATAASPQTKVFRLAFTTPDAARWIEIDLPKDGGGGRDAPPELALVVTLVRADQPETERFTRVVLDRKGGLGAFDPEQAFNGPVEPPAPENVIDLPAGNEPSGVHATRWRQLEQRLRALAEHSTRLVGYVRTPLPNGARVRYADVTAVLDVLLRVGCQQLSIEGATPPQVPQEGGGWPLGDK
jgi:hypothetical protein